MKKFASIASSPRWLAVWVAVIIGSLCFSVGEGLRLTPFPVNGLSQIQEINGLTPANEAVSSFVAKYGPLDVPAPVQKGSKRQTTDFALQPLAAVGEFVPLTVHYSVDGFIQLRSSLFVSGPTGRAPPLVS